MDGYTLVLAIHRIMAPDCAGGSVIAFTDNEDGSGLVLWSRLESRPDIEFIVHRWFDRYSNGEPTADGIHLHSGYYTMDKSAAEADFEARGGWAARAALKGG